MSKIILYPTDLSQWHALVNEAQLSCNHNIAEELESYLVFLLMRFTKAQELSLSVLATDFIESFHQEQVSKIEILRDVGDKSLLFCGLFPGITERKHVNIDYYVDIGRSAYLNIAEIEEADTPGLFSNLFDNFIVMKEVLESTRKINQDIPIVFDEDEFSLLDIKPKLQ